MQTNFWLSPLELTGERVWRTYLGGREIDRLTGIVNPADGHFPEEWIASTVSARNAGREELVEGLCRATLGGEQISLRELIARQPDAMLGSAHNTRFGGQMGVLIKLIDARERLTVQVHPDKQAAMTYFHSPFGKTECWHILSLRADGEEPCLYLGFREGVTWESWRAAYDQQDSAAMLAQMHKVRVRPGETYLIKGGLPHAIGPNCLLVEVQEPTDYTLRIEKVTPAGFAIDEQMIHQGIGEDAMFACFHYDQVADADAPRRWQTIPQVTAQGAGGRVTRLVGAQDTPCFAMERIEVSGQVTLKGAGGQFSCLYAVSGAGTLHAASGELPVSPNAQFFVPAACTDFTITAQPDSPLTLLRCYGPQADET